jgi:hypothetical protein
MRAKNPLPRSPVSGPATVDQRIQAESALARRCGPAGPAPSARAVAVLQRSAGNRAVVGLLAARQAAQGPALQRWTIDEATDRGTAASWLPVTPEAVDAAVVTEGITATASAAQKVALVPTITTGIERFIAWRDAPGAKKARKQKARAERDLAAAAVTKKMNVIALPERRSAAIAAFTAKDAGGLAAHHDFEYMLKKGYISTGTVRSTYKAVGNGDPTGLNDAALGKYSIAMNVDGFPAIVIHVHIQANGEPAPGNGAHWKWKTQELLPAAGKLMTSTEVRDLVDFTAGKAHRDANPAINTR